MFDFILVFSLGTPVFRIGLKMSIPMKYLINCWVCLSIFFIYLIRNRYSVGSKDCVSGAVWWEGKRKPRKFMVIFLIYYYLSSQTTAKISTLVMIVLNEFISNFNFNPALLLSIFYFYMYFKNCIIHTKYNLYNLSN